MSAAGIPVNTIRWPSSKEILSNKYLQFAQGVCPDVSFGKESVPIPACSPGHAIPFFEYITSPIYHHSVRKELTETQKRSRRDCLEQSSKSSRKVLYAKTWIANPNAIAHKCHAEECRCRDLDPIHRDAAMAHGITVKIKLEHFESKGWGIVTEQDIEKGTYICSYIGELISTSEKIKRENRALMNSQFSTHILHVEKGPEFGHQTIDSSLSGNIARYFNHSCDANIGSKVAMSKYGRPMVSFFCLRNVEKGVELTFDYTEGKRSTASKHPCKCGAKKCRKFL
uniref:Histone-lysine N-methyltransferase n=1 Tax=Amorphochlora amoebiformis TaxID=1561963 RepID=A0A7S0CZF8_9EUKA